MDISLVKWQETAAYCVPIQYSSYSLIGSRKELVW